MDVKKNEEASLSLFSHWFSMFAWKSLRSLSVGMWKRQSKIHLAEIFSFFQQIVYGARL